MNELLDRAVADVEQAPGLLGRAELAVHRGVLEREVGKGDLRAHLALDAVVHLLAARGEEHVPVAADLPLVAASDQEQHDQAGGDGAADHQPVGQGHGSLTRRGWTDAITAGSRRRATTGSSTSRQATRHQ